MKPSADRMTIPIRSRPSPAAIVLALTVLGAALRFYRIDHQSAWLDEVSSLRNARAFGAGGLDGLARADQVAPLHSMTLWLMTRIGGDSEVWLRLPSTIAGIVTIPLIYLMGRRLFASPWTGVTAAAIVAISPYAIWYSQEGRMYALLLACTIGFALLSWPVLERRLRPAELLLLTLVSATGYGMHHYMALMVGAFGLFLLIQGQAFKPRAWGWLGTQAIAFLVLAAWLYLTRDRIGNVAGTEKPSFLLWIPYTFYTYVVGFSFGPATRDIQSAGAGLPATVLRHAPAIALAGLSSTLLLAAGARRAFAARHRAAGRWVLIWLVAPILIAVLATVLTNIRYNVRYVIACFPALAILLALGITDVVGRWRRLRERRGGRGRTSLLYLQMAAIPVLLGCMAISLVQLYTDPHYAKEDVRSLASALGRLPQDALLVTDNNRVTKVLAYYEGRVPSASLSVDYSLEHKSPAQIWTHLVAASRVAPAEIVLIEYRSWEGDPDASLRTCLDRHARPITTERFAGAAMTRYRGFEPGDVGDPGTTCRFTRSRL